MGDGAAEASSAAAGSGTSSAGPGFGSDADSGPDAEVLTAAFAEISEHGTGFTVQLDADEAAAWLTLHRPDWVLHELVTNSAKYGSLSTPNGRVCVHWNCRSNGSLQSVLTIRWQEIGGPPVEAPTRRGYGTSVICDLIPYELGGKVDINYLTDGLQCRIEFPLAKDAGLDRSTAFSGSRYPLPPDARSQPATSH